MVSVVFHGSVYNGGNKEFSKGLSPGSSLVGRWIVPLQVESLA
jgi:hypothetical protein